MKLSKELLEKARTAKTVEELMELAKGEKMEISIEQATAYFTKLNQKAIELADEELCNIAKALDYSGAEIEEALKDVDDFPINDEALDNINGGGSIHFPFKGKAQC